MGYNSNVVYVLADVLLDESAEKVQLPKGDTWSVHKFGGTCVASSERIKNVANIIVEDDSERKLVVVSAMSKVTDMMYDLIEKAQSRDDSYMFALDAVLDKHRSTALDLLDGDELGSFLSQLHHDISNLKAMLRAICIGIGPFPISFLLHTRTQAHICACVSPSLYYMPNPCPIFSSLVYIKNVACFMIFYLQLLAASD